MNIEIARSEMLPALSAVAGVVERRQTLPILGNLLLVASDGEIALRGTDLELEIETRAAADIEQDGQITVPARKFAEICRALPDDARIRLRADGEKAVVSSGRSRFTLSTLPAHDFPKMDLGELDVALQVSGVILKRMLDKTSFAMAHQDVRYYLNGVLLEMEAGGLTTVATDGHRLAQVTEVMDTGMDEGREGRRAIIPAKTVVELKRLLPAIEQPVRLELSERMIRVAFGQTVLGSKLVDGRYPEYGRVIPKDLPRRAVVDRDSLRAALQRAAILSNEKYKGVRVTFGPGVLGLQTHNPEREQADDEIELDYEGESVVIGFNVGYMVDVLQAVDRQRVEVAFRDADSSAIWRGENADSETFVVMPMRL